MLVTWCAWHWVRVWLGQILLSKKELRQLGLETMMWFVLDSRWFALCGSCYIHSWSKLKRRLLALYWTCYTSVWIELNRRWLIIFLFPFKTSDAFSTSFKTWMAFLGLFQNSNGLLVINNHYLMWRTKWHWIFPS